MKKIETSSAPAAIGPYSQAYVCNHFLFASGQIPLSPENGDVVGLTMIEQTLQVMKNIGAILDAAGTSFDRVVKTTCFLNDMSNFEAFNQVYAEYFTNYPARSCVSVKQLPKGVLCEVEFIAEV